MTEKTTGDTVSFAYFGTEPPVDKEVSALHVRAMGERLGAVVERVTSEFNAGGSSSVEVLESRLASAMAKELELAGWKGTEAPIDWFDKYDRLAKQFGGRQVPEIRTYLSSQPELRWVVGIRARYPNAYDDFSDAELKNALDAKFPLSLQRVQMGDDPELIYFPAGTSEPSMQRALDVYVNGPWRERRVVLGWAVLFWMGPMVLLYGLGWGIGWVIRGFRQGAA